ncbi:MAG: HNH endonuclease [Sphingobacteriales bacterium]|nr:HNH endonuclease [Sphingobacteriales bacterium]
MLRKLYPHHYTQWVAQEIGRSVSSIYGMANILGLHKHEAFRLAELKRQADKLRIVGAPSRYKKGRVPDNKGKKMSPEHYEKMRPSMFGKGHPSANKVPVGTTRTTKDGYMEMKVADPNRWQVLHRMMWEDTFGPIPKGGVVRFRTADKTNYDPINLELITRKEHMLRNSIARFPQEMKQVIKLTHKLKKQIYAKEQN